VEIQAGRQPTGLPTGLGLERLVPGGIPRDKVTALFSESGNFKSTTLAHMLYTMGAAGYRSLLITWEDTARYCAHKFLARNNGLPYGAINGGILSPEERARLVVTPDGAAAGDNMYVTDEVDPTIDAILDLATRAKNSPRGLDCLAIDYVQQVQGRGNGTEVMTEALVKLQRWSNRTGTAVIVVSQQKQENDLGRTDPRPRMGDMYGTSAMRQACKLILGVFRPWYYWKVPSSPRDKLNGEYAKFISANPENIDVYPNLLEVWVAKQNGGPQQVMVTVLVNPETGEMANGDALMAPYY
jgi:replicative DNA helicase